MHQTIQRIKNKLTKLSSGHVCILTKESTPQVSIEAAHLVPHITSGTPVHPDPPRSIRLIPLHMDTMGNLVYIRWSINPSPTVRVDLHHSFDNMGWFLLPGTNIIKRVQQHKPGTGNYKQVFMETEFTYRIILMQLFCDRSTVFQRVSLDLEGHKQIFPTDPSSPLRVTSHINPFFIIANAGAKITDNMAVSEMGFT
ncbi:hypothetical protein C8R44DRAFT_750495 [Mycena epipterygia]|nr:hypothetical protein C8R44DRAFT_750495 [Mycena epipterygia]